MIYYFLALIVLSVVLIMHLFGLDGLYYTYDPYDVIMHFLGGLGIGLFMTALFNSFSSSSKNQTVTIIFGVIIIGIIWELFEYYYDIAGSPIGTKLYYIDTVKDLINDAIGGSVIAYLVKKFDSKK